MTVTHDGNLVQVILLPSVFIVLESTIDEMAVQRFRQFKTKSKEQLSDIIKTHYKPNKIQLYSKKELLGTTNLTINEKHKNLYDLFRAAERGLEFLYKAPIHVQILKFPKVITVVIKFVNRVAFLEFEMQKTSSSITGAVIGFTKTILGKAISILILVIVILGIILMIVHIKNKGNKKTGNISEYGQENTIENTSFTDFK